MTKVKISETVKGLKGQERRIQHTHANKTALYGVSGEKPTQNARTPVENQFAVCAVHFTLTGTVHGP